jgi:ubiquinone/menaquinone biosynthesis C-methylase UbiE
VTSAASAGVPTGNTYDKYGSANPLVRRMMAGFFAALDALLPAAAPATVLEVGIGEAEVAGRLADRYPAASIVGIDLPDDDLADAWAQTGVSGAFADIARLPFPDDRFDLVLAIEVLEHVPDPEAALAELARVARHHLVLSVPREPVWRVANLARGKYVRALGNTPGHIQHWSRQAFVDLVASRFTVTEVRAPFPWTMVAARTR